MSDAHRFSRDIVARLQERDIEDATTATAYCMAVVATAHADLNIEQARQYVREVLLPMANKIISDIEALDAKIGRQLQ